MPEPKIFTDQNGLYVQIAQENLLDKFRRERDAQDQV